jgi:hypothetical protein
MTTNLSAREVEYFPRLSFDEGPAPFVTFFVFLFGIPHLRDLHYGACRSGRSPACLSFSPG